MNGNKITRRKFVAAAGTVAAGSILFNPLSIIAAKKDKQKMKIAVVGTGVRGVKMYGTRLVKDYADYVEFVGLCDINPGRVKYGREYIGVDCLTFIDLEEMLVKVKPEWLIVTTVDSTHHDMIITGLKHGCNIITEKPLTTDETKAQAILEAERKYGKKVIVTFNYRYSPHRAKMKELITQGAIGTITSVDFHWYLNTEHGPRYFRRWHGEKDKSGTLLVHKSTHHFDLVNWWLDTDPKEVYAYGALEYFGKNGPFRGEKCRTCQHKNNCKFYWDITKNDHLTKLYVNNESYDGYIRDNCVYRENIDIFDKMSVQVKYMNDVVLNYSLTTYSPYEGYRIAFNGTKGRMEAWIKEKEEWLKDDYDEIMLTKLFQQAEYIRIDNTEEGHGGGDRRMLDKIFRDQTMADPLNQSAGTRDGVMSILTGIAARKSIYSGKPVLIEGLTEIKPSVDRKS